MALRNYYGQLLRTYAKNNHYSLEYSEPQLVNGGLAPPPARGLPGTECYMVIVTVNNLDFFGFGPSASLAKRYAEQDACKSIVPSESRASRQSPLLEGIEEESDASSTLISGDPSNDQAMLPSNNVVITEPLADFNCSSTSSQPVTVATASLSTPVPSSTSDSYCDIPYAANNSSTNSQSAKSDNCAVPQTPEEFSSILETPPSVNDPPSVVTWEHSMVPNRPRDVVEALYDAARKKGVHVRFFYNVIKTHNSQCVVVRAEAGGFSFEGRHFRKYMAKCEAAAKLLETINQLPDQSSQHISNVPTPPPPYQPRAQDPPKPSSPLPSSPVDSKASSTSDKVGSLVTSNPVGQLNELLTKERLDMPMYAFNARSIGNFTEFSCVASAKGLSAKGVGSSKKLAKRHAAENLLFHMESQGMNIDASPKSRRQASSEEQMEGGNVTPAFPVSNQSSGHPGSLETPLGYPHCQPAHEKALLLPGPLQANGLHPPQMQVRPPPQMHVRPPPQTHASLPSQMHVRPPPQMHARPPPQMHVRPPPQTHASPPSQMHAHPPPVMQAPLPFGPPPNYPRPPPNFQRFLPHPPTVVPPPPLPASHPPPASHHHTRRSDITSSESESDSECGNISSGLREIVPRMCGSPLHTSRDTSRDELQRLPETFQNLSVDSHAHDFKPNTSVRADPHYISPNRTPIDTATTYTHQHIPMRGVRVSTQDSNPPRDSFTKSPLPLRARNTASCQTYPNSKPTRHSQSRSRHYAPTHYSLSRPRSNAPITGSGMYSLEESRSDPLHFMTRLPQKRKKCWSSPGLNRDSPKFSKPSWSRLRQEELRSRRRSLPMINPSTGNQKTETSTPWIPPVHEMWLEEDVDPRAEESALPQSMSLPVDSSCEPKDSTEGSATTKTLEMDKTEDTTPFNKCTVDTDKVQADSGAKKDILEAVEIPNNSFSVDFSVELKEENADSSNTTPSYPPITEVWSSQSEDEVDVTSLSDNKKEVATCKLSSTDLKVKHLSKKVVTSPLTELPRHSLLVSGLSVGQASNSISLSLPTVRNCNSQARSLKHPYSKSSPRNVRHDSIHNSSLKSSTQVKISNSPRAKALLSNDDHISTNVSQQEVSTPSSRHDSHASSRAPLDKDSSQPRRADKSSHRKMFKFSSSINCSGLDDCGVGLPSEGSLQTVATMFH